MQSHLFFVFRAIIEGMIRVINTIISLCKRKLCLMVETFLGHHTWKHTLVLMIAIGFGEYRAYTSQSHWQATMVPHKNIYYYEGLYYFHEFSHRCQQMTINLTHKPQHSIVWLLHCFRQVPALEHNGRIKVESLEILQYMENNFNGPKLFPQVCILLIETISFLIDLNFLWAKVKSIS